MKKIDQRGITLVELLIATAIAVLLIAVLGTTIYQILTVTGQGVQELGALRDIQNAGYWLSQDGKRAQTTDLVDGADPVPALTLSWTDADGTHTTTYSLSGSGLQRNYDGEVITVARYISDVQFSMVGGLIHTHMTSSPDGKWERSREGSYQVSLRPTSDD